MLAKMLHVDWHAAFTPSVPFLEIVFRGSVVYLFIFLLLRLVVKREAGNVGITDLLVTVLIADAAQNAMSAQYHSLTDGAVLVSTLVFWSWMLDWLASRSPRIARLVHPPPLLLVRDGHILQRNLRRELITEEEMLGQLREQGIDDVARVREAYMESDGRISVVEGHRHRAPPRRAGN